MTHWNHRVVKKYYPKDDYTEFSIKEVYYNDDDSIYAYMENPCKVTGESLESLRQFLQRCLKSLDQPVLVDGEIVFVDDGDSEEDCEKFNNIEDMMKSLEDDEQ